MWRLYRWEPYVEIARKTPYATGSERWAMSNAQRTKGTNGAKEMMVRIQTEGFDVTASVWKLDEDENILHLSNITAMEIDFQSLGQKREFKYAAEDGTTGVFSGHIKRIELNNGDVQIRMS
ncbi:hypothetical protein OAH18_00615 [bacterium]|nr:hypothetical protein [bacterium]